MNCMMRVLALCVGLVFSGLVFPSTSQAVDISAAEEPTGLAWYFGLFGGYKLGNGDVHVTSFRESCLIFPICRTFEGEVHGEVDNGWIGGGVLGAELMEGIRAEIEVSHARLDTETTAVEIVTPFLGDPEAFTTTDNGQLRELFIMANVWFEIPVSSFFSPYLGGGIGVAHVNGDFGVDSFGDPGNELSASIHAEGWSLAYQIGTGLLIGLSDNLAVDLGYRFKIISAVDLDEPEFCGGDDCDPPVETFTADDDFGVYQHVFQAGLTLGF
jgi:opacity protein-like surface antigen